MQLREAQVDIEILTGAETLHVFRGDLSLHGNAFAWGYLLNEKFTEAVLEAREKTATISMIIDHRMLGVAARLQQKFPNFAAWSWSYNRTMHDKTWVFPAQGVIYIGTYNLTKGSYWLSLNRTVRIRSQAMTAQLMHMWNEDRQKATKVKTASNTKEKDT